MGQKNTNNIGLVKKHSDILVRELNDLLANYQVFYMNIRGFHWNIKGDSFFDLHERFEFLYTDLLNKIDELGERILAFGEVPMHSYEKYLSTSEIRPVENLVEGKAIAQSIVYGLMKLTTMQRKIAYAAKGYDDEGTYQMLSTYVKEQEKQLWMYNAFLGK